MGFHPNQTTRDTMETEKLIEEVDNPYAALAYAMKQLQNNNQQQNKQGFYTENPSGEESFDSENSKIKKLEQRIEVLEKNLLQKQGSVSSKQTQSPTEEVRLEERLIQETSEQVEETSDPVDSVDVKEEEEDSEFSNITFDCPQCGETIAVSEWSSHISASNLQNMKEHKPLSSRLQVKNDGSYYMPDRDESFGSYEEVSTRIKNMEVSLGEYIYRYRDALGVKNLFESPFDENGNLKIRKNKRNHVEDYSKDELESMFVEYLEGQSQRKTMKEIGKDRFDESLESGTAEYTKVYEVLTDSNQINVDNSSNANEYWTGSDPANREDDGLDLPNKVINKLGSENNYRVLLHAVSKLAPKESGVEVVSYYGGRDTKAFTSEFSGAKDLEGDKAWEYLHNNSAVRSAISGFLGGEFNLKSVKNSDVRSQDPTKAWNLKIYRKSG